MERLKILISTKRWPPRSKPPITYIVSRTSRKKPSTRCRISTIWTRSVHTQDIPMHQAWFTTILRQIINSLSSDSRQRRQYIRALRKTCGLQGILPTSYMVAHTFIKTAGQLPFGSGGFADVWKHTDKNIGQAFAVKCLRVYESDATETINKV